MRPGYLLAVPVALSCLTTGGPAAEPLRGAAEVLRRTADQSGKADPATKPPSDSAKLRADLTNFTTRAASLAPAAAAREWLELGDRFAKLPVQARFGAGRGEEPALQVQELLMALPPPAAWDELAKAIAARPVPGTLAERREFGLRMLGLALTGDRAALARQASAFEALLLKAKRDEAMQLVHVFRALDDALLALSDDPQAILAGVERQLSAAERDRDFGYGSINLPDLAAIVGQDEATPYVRRALLSKANSLSIEGKATQTLARQLALAVVEEMKVPRWGLVESLDALELYEALEKKFAQTRPEKATNASDAIADLEQGRFGDGYEKQTAKTYYLMALIVRGRTDDAARFARRAAEEGGEFQVESAAVAALERAGFTQALDTFLHELLSQTPDLPYWETYFGVAAQTGNTDRMLTLARAAAAKADLAADKSGSIRENLCRALLAADQVEEGVKELRALLATAPKARARNLRKFRGGAMQSIDWNNHALTLARLGHLLEKPEWVAEGLAAAMHLGQLGREHRLPAAERDDIVFNILRLDPLGRHTSANLETVSDLQRLWTAVEAAAKFQVKAPTALLPLPASREEVEKQERAAKSQPDRLFGSYTSYSGSSAASPGQALAQHQLLAAIGGLMGGAGEFGFEE